MAEMGDKTGILKNISLFSQIGALSPVRESQQKTCSDVVL